MNHIENYLSEVIEVTKALNREDISSTISILSKVKADKGRLFFIGVGGSAANASHAVNDFRKIAGIESYTPTDNVSELTARINDNGWDLSIRDWLVTSNITEKDCLFVLSVGGGNEEKNISVNLINAIKYFKEKKAKVVGIIGRDGGFTRKNADASILIPVVNINSVTTHSEAFQAIIWHLLVSHPDIQTFSMKWESTK